jgi:hypothetical protein
MIDKSINILIYKPGYFGNIVKFLLSLDDVTYPFWPISEPFDETKSRSYYLNFDNIRWKYGSWEKFHNAFGGTSTRTHGKCNDLDEFLISDYKSLTVYGHPSDINLFFQVNSNKISNHCINYLTTYLSPEYEVIVKDFLIQNNNWPYIKTQELDLYHTMIEKYNPYTINLDNFVTGTNNFLQELDKLNKHCGLNTNISESLKVYKSWVTARKLHLYSFFQDQHN